ncbi:SNF2 family N-terminal domain-containing protein [Phycomyces blakesleeanus]
MILPGWGRPETTNQNHQNHQNHQTATLLSIPKTPLDQMRNEWLLEREKKLQAILSRHDATVRELYHLEVYQTMLGYNPEAMARNNDERLLKFTQNYDLWDLVDEHLFQKNQSSRNTRKPLTQRRTSIVQLLQNSVNQDTALISSDAPKPFEPAYTSLVHTGTGIRRHHRQFHNLRDYMDSFVSIDDNEDITPKQADELFKKEIIIRQRLEALQARGGFSTRLQAVASRRPAGIERTLDTHHDVLVQHCIAAAKNFQSNTKYRRNAARRCAKAVDRYWESIRTHDKRLVKEESRRMAKLAKWAAQQVKKKWKVVERVCEARHEELLKEEQAKKGRRHLELILEHSEQMLGVRMEELSHKPLSVSKDSGSNVGSPEPDWEEDERDHRIEEEGESEDDAEELEELTADQDLSVEELMKKYNYRPNEDSESDRNGAKSDSGNTDISEAGNAHQNFDNEQTLSLDSESENRTQPVNHDDEYGVQADDEEEDIPIENDGESEDDDVELNGLAEEAEMSVEELMKRYNYNPSYVQSDTDADDEEDDVEEKEEEKEEKEEEKEEEEKKAEKEEQQEELPTAVNSKTSSSTALVTLAEPELPTGTTLKTTNVDTPIPFLLRGTLREYQHVGLDWLASLYSNGLNGILADEMGLGKTIQTIALLAYLACEKGIWGPHLIVVPTSVILNWEMEFKRWLPGFKILTYYGNPKERKEKRFGWSKENAFHVCITSYQLVIQDQTAFRRKAWQYLVLDEAHHIKNFRSQRWQVLLNFNSRRRLLLTGTPLQNNLMELWSLLYFLMPNGISQSMPIGFANLKEFQEWFSHPVDRMIEGQQGMDEESRQAIQKLHTVLRPYLLRRLKADVEKQLPEKHEHIVYCRLSKRQRYLYDDFMSRAKTKETLSGANFLSIINCLMQLRKVCNHPDLFEERPILTSFSMTDQVQVQGERIEKWVRKRFLPIQEQNLRKTLFGFLGLILMQHETEMSATVAKDMSFLDATPLFVDVIKRHTIRGHFAESRGVVSKDYQDLKKYAAYRETQKHLACAQRWQSMLSVNQFRCGRQPVYGAGLIDILRRPVADTEYQRFFPSAKDKRTFLDRTESVRNMVQSYEKRMKDNNETLERYGFVTPPAVIYRPKPNLLPPYCPPVLSSQLRTILDNDIFHPIQSRLSIAFPDKRLLQFDCGKLQKLEKLLRVLAAGGHRALIFTQMTRVLDVLETFLNMHGHRYLRLDGATKIEQRQGLTEQFNNDKRILCFILSTRSGGLGINLTGADTVIFYDSDWNPSMDKQCQDRTHRIGQTRDVHIYRFVTEFTIEENIFKKANQKRMLDNVIIQDGAFTTDYFHRMDWWRDLPEVTGSSGGQPVDFEKALLEAEGDENDAAAAIAARNEMAMDEIEFEDSIASQPQKQPLEEEEPRRQSSPGSYEDEDEDEMQLAVGHVDQYMLRFWEREMFGKYLGFGGLPEPDRIEEEGVDLV